MCSQLPTNRGRTPGAGSTWLALARRSKGHGVHQLALVASVREMSRNRPINLSMTSLAPSRSWILAGCGPPPTAAHGIYETCRFRPLIFLPAHSHEAPFFSRLHALARSLRCRRAQGRSETVRSRHAKTTGSAERGAFRSKYQDAVISGGGPWDDRGARSPTGPVRGGTIRGHLRKGKAGPLRRGIVHEGHEGGRGDTAGAGEGGFETRPYEHTEQDRRHSQSNGVRSRRHGA